MNPRRIALSLSSALGLSALVSAGSAAAHCDTLSGPVITAARQALDGGNPNPVLAWVQPSDEATIREQFTKTLQARRADGKTKDAADQAFFETLVRIHRAGEGAPYTGVKPANTDIGVAVPAADRALETGSATEVQKIVGDAVQTGLQKHFQEALERRKYDVNDVNAGREFVKAYVEYTHYVEGLYDKATSSSLHEHGAVPDGHAEHAAVHGTTGHEGRPRPDSHAVHDGHAGPEAREGHAGHSGHAGHLPWLLSGFLGLGLIAETGWLLRRKRA